MKAEELMVGDLVVVYHDVPSEAFLVPEVHKVTPFDIYRNSEGFKPIPLSTGILERNGFGKGAEHIIRHKDKEGGYSLWEHYGDDGSVSFVWLAMYYSEEFSDYYSAGNTEIEIRYVHELQHALRHIGIEKEIQL